MKKVELVNINIYTTERDYVGTYWRPHIYISGSDTVVGIYNFLPLLSSQCFIFILFIALSGECNLLDSVSSQQKFEAMDIKALGKSQLSDSLCYSSQTDQFI